LRGIWQELTALAGDGEPVEYWAFVRRDNYQETVRRAYYVSFLLTYGFAKMYREGTGMRLVPVAAPTGKTAPGLVSYPIPITRTGTE
jgi:hypothetical protein